MTSTSEKPSRSRSVVASVMKRLRSDHHSKATNGTNGTEPPVTLTTSLEGKVAVITGSSRLIGAAIARYLAEQGANVVVNYLKDAKSADTVVRGINSLGKGTAVAIRADVSSFEGGKYLLDETVKAFGKLDILILNSSVTGSKPLADIDEAFFDVHMNVNVKAPLFLVKAALPLLPAPGGRIIFFSSSLTSMSYISPGALCYAASKGAIEQISRILAKDLGARGMTVNVISPGPEADMLRDGKPHPLIDEIAKQNPAGRIGVPDDIAPMVAFLVSPAAQWVNGQNIRVNGGAIV